MRRAIFRIAGLRVEVNGIVRDCALDIPMLRAAKRHVINSFDASQLIGLQPASFPELAAVLKIKPPAKPPQRAGKRKKAKKLLQPLDYDENFKCTPKTYVPLYPIRNWRSRDRSKTADISQR